MVWYNCTTRKGRRKSYFLLNSAPRNRRDFREKSKRREKSFLYIPISTLNKKIPILRGLFLQYYTYYTFYTDFQDLFCNTNLCKDNLYIILQKLSKYTKFMFLFLVKIKKYISECAKTKFCIKLLNVFIYFSHDVGIFRLRIWTRAGFRFTMLMQKTMHLRVATNSTKCIASKQTASFRSPPFPSTAGILFANIKTMTRSLLRACRCVWSLLYFLLILISARKNFPVRAGREFFRA